MRTTPFVTFITYSYLLREKKGKKKETDRQTGLAYTDRQQSRKQDGEVGKKLSQPTQSRDKNTSNPGNQHPQK